MRPHVPCASTYYFAQGNLDGIHLHDAPIVKAWQDFLLTGKASEKRRRCFEIVDLQENLSRCIIPEMPDPTGMYEGSGLLDMTGVDMFDERSA